MKFKPLEDFKHGPTTFETDNTYSSEKHGLTDDEVASFYRNGWAEVEGWNPPPPRRAIGAELKMDKATHATQSPEVGSNGEGRT